MTVHHALRETAASDPLVVVSTWRCRAGRDAQFERVADDLVAEHVEGLPLLVRSAVLPLVLLSLMTYVMMPLVTRVLAGWLEAR